MNAADATGRVESHRLEVRRVIARPADVVFKAWITPESVAKFMGEPGTKLTVSEVKVGAKYRIDMVYQGKSYPHEGEYLEITPPRRLKFTWISEGTQQQRTVVTVDFIPSGSGTEVVLTHEGLPTEANAKDHEAGWTEILQWQDERL